VSVPWKRLAGPLLAVLFGGGIFVAILWSMGRPGFWESQISSYEKADRAHPPNPGCIVFTGSSSIRFWHTLSHDMKPLDAINRGFGGSQISHVNKYASRIVIPYRPRAVVLYAGDNDLSWPWSKSPETVRADFERFVEIIHAALPDTWIYYVSMRSAPLRWTDSAKIKDANRRIEEFCRAQNRVQFIDVQTAMLDARRQLRGDLFGWDRLHMNAQGYAIWTAVIKPILLTRF
jgi:lysophospholipase L1-like esterase